MAREVAGIEVQLELNNTQFRTSIAQANDALEVFERNTKGGAKTLANMETRQKFLTKALKETAIGTAEFKKLASELQTVNRELADTNFEVSGLDREMKNLTGSFRELDAGDRASRIRGVSGGFTDLTRAVGGSQSAIGATADIFDQFAISASGAFDIAQDGTELLGVSSAAMGALGLSIGAAIVAYNAFDTQQRIVNTGINAMVEGVKEANSQLDILDLTNLATAGQQQGLNYQQAEAGLAGLLDKLQELRNERAAIEDKISRTDLTVGSGLADTFGFGDFGELQEINAQIKAIEESINNVSGGPRTKYNTVLQTRKEQLDLEKALIVLKADEEKNLDAIYAKERRLLFLESSKFEVGSRARGLLEAQITALDVVYQKQKKVTEEIAYRNGLVGDADFYKNLKLDGSELPDAPEIEPASWVARAAEEYDKAQRALREYSDYEQQQIEENAAFAKQVQDRRDAEAKREIDTQKAVESALTQSFNAVGQAAINSAIDQETAGGRIAASVASVATNVISAMLAQTLAVAISNANQTAAATGPLAAITAPAFIAQQVGTVLGAFASIPKFSSGALINVGEAGQSEAVIPTNRMAEVLGGFEGAGGNDRPIVVEVDGEAILRSSERASNRRGRTRGINSRF